MPTSSSARPSSTRLRWIDATRGVAVILVVFWHAASVPVTYGDRHDMQWLVHLNGVLEPYRIPTLLFLSGLLVPRSAEKPVEAFLWGKIRHIAWPYLVWMGVMWCVPNFSYLFAYPRVWLGDYGNYLWFLVVLFCCYVAVPAARLFRVPWWILAVLSWGLLFWLDPDDAAWQRQLWWSGFFFVGAAAVDLVPKWQRVRPATALLLLPAVVLWPWSSATSRSP